MELIFILLIGVLIGFGVSFFFKPKNVGSLRVDHSDPDSGPYLFMEIAKGGMDKIRSSKYITLKVEIKNYISRD